MVDGVIGVGFVREMVGGPTCMIAWPDSDPHKWPYADLDRIGVVDMDAPTPEHTEPVAEQESPLEPPEPEKSTVADVGQLEDVLGPTTPSE